ncbi:hypothetical protein ARSEF4850_009595 [Beauveria asiatica]
MAIKINELLSATEALKSSGVADHAQDQRLQELFDLSINLDHEHLPDRFKTATIMIKWVERLDDLGLSDEVKALNNVWQDEYGYSIQLLELDDQEPQNQIVDTLDKFINKASDDDVKTVIVHYGGHGDVGPLGQLILAAVTFTTALTWALRELSTASIFTTSQLLQKLFSCPKFPENQFPIHWKADSEQRPDITSNLSDDWIGNIENYVQKWPRNDGDGGKVKIAIIDTGYDANHPLFQLDKCVKNHKAFIVEAQNDPFERVRESQLLASDRDVLGHGTHGTYTICTLAPNAEVYVAKVTDGPRYRSLMSYGVAEHYVDNFATLGEEVRSAWPKHMRRGLEHRMSGTSVATPIAASIAAQVLEFGRKELEDEQKRLLRTYDGMREVLLEMAIDAGGYWYLNPAEFFGGRMDQDGKTEEALGRIKEALSRVKLRAEPQIPVSTSLEG